MAVVGGRLSLEDLDEWLLDHSWNMHQDSDEAAQNLASDVGILLYEHSDGHRSESDLKQRFAVLARPVAVLFKREPRFGADHGDSCWRQR